MTILVTWVVAHLYYRQGMAASRREEANTRAILDKLPEIVVGKLTAETRRQLTVEELEELIAEADAYPTPYGSFPNKCPICGAPTETRRHGPTEYSEKGVWPVCTSCGWGGG